VTTKISAKSLKSLALSPRSSIPPAPDNTYSSSFNYDDFVAAINDAIKEIEDNRDDYSIEFRRELFLDDKGKPQQAR